MRIAIVSILTNFAKVAKLHNVTKYPDAILETIRNARHQSRSLPSNAEGREVNFSCACFVQFSANVDGGGDGRVDGVGFRSNGCGYMIAAAEIVASEIDGGRLADLHGLDREYLLDLLRRRIGEINADRLSCIESVLGAVKKMFAAYRELKVKEFTGEKALICTCFGISEERIETIVAERSGITVEGIASEYRAGSGCGSCRMLIQEILDSST